MTDPRTQRTRDALLDAAEALFAERGFSGVGSRELVARAGANVAAIRYHFGSKRGLYVEAVRRAMLRPEIRASWDALPGATGGRERAARGLAVFVLSLTGRLLSDRDLGACTRLMLREAMQPSEALPEVVERFVRPHEDRLAATVRCVAPRLGPRDARLAARAVLGQILHQHLFRPFFEQRRGAPYDDDAIRAIAEHVVRFSLRALGCSERRIERSLATALPATLPARTTDAT